MAVRFPAKILEVLNLQFILNNYPYKSYGFASQEKMRTGRNIRRLPAPSGLISGK
jgi:hypothetical protein